MINVAMIGVGAISGIYLKNLTLTFKEVELIGVCDLIPERAQKGVDYVKEENRSVAIGWKSAIGGVAGFLTACIESAFIEKVESNGNVIFGLTVYPQQILSLVSTIILIILAIYLYKVVRNQKVVIKK